MKGKTLALAFALLLTLVPATAPAGAAAFTPVTGWEMMEKLGMGYNHGQLAALDSAKNEDGSYKSMGLESEVCYGGEYIQQWHIKSMARKGFSSVRVMVTWQPHLDAEYNIDPAWMDRVQQVIDWAIAEGLYVIVNTHNEFLFYDFLGEGNTAEAERYLLTLWAQISERFKNYSEKLIFEPMNEPCLGMERWLGEEWSDEADIAALNDTVNSLNAAALGLIRKSGGNNGRRVVLQTVAQAASWWLRYYDQPDDPYTMVGVFLYPILYNSDFSKADWEEVSFTQIEAAIAKGIPVVFKETCPYYPDFVFDEDRALAWSLTAYNRVAATGAAPMYFPLPGVEVFNYVTGEWFDPLLDILFEAYGKTPGTDYPAPPIEWWFPYELSPETGSRNLSPEIAAAAKTLVIEFDGTPDGYWVSAAKLTSGAPDWTYYEIWNNYQGEPRVVELEGKIMVDLSGLDGYHIVSYFLGESKKANRVYLSDKPIPPPAFPYEIKGPYQAGVFTFCRSAREVAAADKMVVEIEGELSGGYAFVRHTSDWTQFDNGHALITEEPGKITFDLRGLEGNTVGFAAWTAADAAKIKRVYLDGPRSPSLFNFTKIQTYDNNFTDIDGHYAKDWIIKAYDYGIIAGSGNTYGTTDNMTIQNALVIASKMHGIYNTGDYDYNSHGAYPGGFITYALENGIIDSRFDGRYAQDATRGELAYIWGNILPKEELQKLNDYAPFSDVPEGHTYYEEIKLFYEAGIVTGSEGRFNPDSNIIRGDCAVMFVRLVSVTDRSGWIK